jgi:hypothetical protein
MYIYKSALRTECEFRLRSYTTNYLQKPDIDLEAVVEAKIVIRRLIGERNNAHAWESLFDKACVIALEFEIEVSRPRLFGRQRNRVNYPVDNPSDYWRISLFLVFLDHLAEAISKSSSKLREAGFFVCAFYLNPANLLNPTPEIVDRLFIK